MRGRSARGHFEGPGCLLLILCALIAGCDSEARFQRGESVDDPILILAAADLQVALGEIARRYEEETNRRVLLVFGSTGNLATQIEHGAPGDLFFAANESFLDRLIERGHIVPESRVVYGVGRLAAVVATGVQRPTSLSDLAGERYGTIAIANPEHAPYGVAAWEALQAVAVLDAVRPRLVYGENIAQALQFVRTGNADVGLVALGLLSGSVASSYLLIDDSLHAPLRQAAGILTESRNAPAARGFLGYVAGEVGRDILARYGFAPAGS